MITYYLYPSYIIPFKDNPWEKFNPVPFYPIELGTGQRNWTWKVNFYSFWVNQHTLWNIWSHAHTPTFFQTQLSVISPLQAFLRHTAKVMTFHQQNRYKIDLVHGHKSLSALSIDDVHTHAHQKYVLRAEEKKIGRQPWKQNMKKKKKKATTTNENIIQWGFISWVISEPTNWMGKTMTNIIIDMIL